MSKKVATIFCVLLMISTVYGQDVKSGNKELKNHNYRAALNIFEKIYAKDSANKELNFSMGVCYFHLKDYNKSESHFLKSSSAVSLELFRYKAAVAHAKMKFKKATNFYNAYKLIAGKKEMSNATITKQVDKVKYAELAIKDRRNVIVSNFRKINTEADEHLPHVIADESRLIYVANSSKSSIYSISKHKNDFTEAKMLGKNINDQGYELGGLSTDGQTMFLVKDGDIYECKMGLDDWEDPIKMGSSINSDYNESSVTITLDDKVMYFVSDRPGGHGGKDIYKALRLPNGKWSKALNIGPSINSAYNEESPFIHSDKKTLYFSSEGHQNMGGYDIFKSVLEKGVWSSPENLKYPINTVDDDLNYTVVGSGKIAYYANYKATGKGGMDIYKVVLKDEFSQFHVLKAAVKDKKGNPLPAKITLIENESKKVKGIYKANSITGKFIMLVDPEKTYNIIIEANEYHSYTKKLSYNINSTETIDYKLDKQ
jgi:tetratricopeptide (TPR) repeat protein